MIQRFKANIANVADVRPVQVVVSFPKMFIEVLLRSEAKSTLRANEWTIVNLGVLKGIFDLLSADEAHLIWIFDDVIMLICHVFSCYRFCNELSTTKEALVIIRLSLWKFDAFASFYVIRKTFSSSVKF
jgi:hypothetical protein